MKSTLCKILAIAAIVLVAGTVFPVSQTHASPVAAPKDIPDWDVPLTFRFLNDTKLDLEFAWVEFFDENGVFIDCYNIPPSGIIQADARMSTGYLEAFVDAPYGTVIMEVNWRKSPNSNDLEGFEGGVMTSVRAPIISGYHYNICLSNKSW